MCSVQLDSVSTAQNLTGAPWSPFAGGLRAGVLEQIPEPLAQGNRALVQAQQRLVVDQAVGQAAWSSDELVSLTELRHVHRFALAPVWNLAPHPDANPG